MAKKKILVVDDEQDFTMLMKMNLAETGKYEVMTVNDARQALGAARKFKPDLIFLDIMMPDMDGGEIAQRAESDDNLKDIPIVFVTAVMSKAETTSQTKLKGKYPLLAKPVTIEELDSCIEKILGQ